MRFIVDHPKDAKKDLYHKFAKGVDGRRASNVHATMEARDELLLIGSFTSTSSRVMGCQPVTSGNPRVQPLFRSGEERCESSTGIDPRRIPMYSEPSMEPEGEIGRPFELKYGAVAALRG